MKQLNDIKVEKKRGKDFDLFDKIGVGSKNKIWFWAEIQYNNETQRVKKNTKMDLYLCT